MQRIVSRVLLISILVCFFLNLNINRSSEKQYSTNMHFGQAKLGTFINWTQFWNIFNAHSDWDLEYHDGVAWQSIKSDIQIIKNYKFFDVGTREWVDVDISEASACKITLNFTASHTAFYRLTFGIDLDVKNYTYKSDWFNYTITYGNYTVIFDWTDLKNILNLDFSHGIKPVEDEFWFWFRIKTTIQIPKGKNVLLDPWFGLNYIPYLVGFETIENYVKGSIFTCPDNGVADSITVALMSWRLEAWSGKVRCAIYNDDLSFYAETEERTVTPPLGAFAWFQFNFSVPKPSLTANYSYILVAWAEAKVNDVRVAYSSADNPQTTKHSKTYNGFPNPIYDIAYYTVISIYCNYTKITRTWQDISQWNFNLPTKAWNSIAVWTFDIITQKWRTIAEWFLKIMFPLQLPPFILKTEIPSKAPIILLIVIPVAIAVALIVFSKR